MLQLEKHSTSDYTCSRFCDKKIPVGDTNTASIVLILESPHKDEFTGEYNPITPAQGETGENLKSELLGIIENAINDKILRLENIKYNFYLVNPIPFQSSLFHIHNCSLSKKGYEKLRNNVWKHLWKNNDSFKNELKKLILNINPKIIINGATAEVSKSISLELLNESGYNQFDKFKIAHPSSWKRNTRNRILKTLI